MITFSKLGKFGRLGNQLFQISSTIGIANKNNLSYGFPEWEYSKYFEKKLPEFNDLIQYREFYIDFCYKEFIIVDRTDIQGYFQSWKFFKEIDIINIFKLKSEYEKYIDKYNYKNTVSIHVRRGDYLNNTHVYPILSYDYYIRSLDLIKKSGVINPTIFIFSDDIEWCKNKFDFPNQIFIQEEQDIIELFIMSRCKNNIISNSTFSWWAAYLNQNIDKIVICPDVWFNNTSEIINFNYNDLIPEEWIKINI
jgi:hypothetical protein